MTTLGVFGAGVMGANHVRTARAIREWDDVIVVDVDGARAKKIADANGFRWSSAVDGVLPFIDAAIVAVPSALHEEVTLPRLARRTPVLLEKPVADDPDAADRIAAAAAASGAPVLVGHIERFNAAVAELLRWAPAVQHVELRRVSPAGGRALGDVVSDLMVHDLDLALALSKARDGHMDIETCHAQWGAGSQEMCSALITTASGLTISVVASRMHQLKNRTAILTCADTVVTADLVRQSVSIERMDQTEFITDGVVRFRQTGTTEIPFLDSGEPLLREQRHFFEVATGRAEPLVSLGDGLAAMQLVERVRAAAGTPRA